MSSKTFRWPVRVYYEDTDAGRIVYHARYVAFYERARTEVLREFNFSQQQLLEENVAFAVRSMTVEFISAARLDDLLEVSTKILTIKGASMLFKQSIHNQKGMLVGTAEVLIASVDPELGKPVAIPKSIVAEFKNNG